MRAEIFLVKFFFAEAEKNERWTKEVRESSPLPRLELFLSAQKNLGDFFAEPHPIGR